ncbi:SurA N-terminal domain-containing protein [SAR86 cluster bacterium]|nr:SurA N-terminal domain-containing protein [SAR86 cluster bacterium]
MSGIQTIREGLTGNVTRVIVVAIIITFIGSVGWAGFFSQGNVNIVATVGSKEITNADLNFEVSTQQFALSQRFPDQEIDDETLFTLSKNNLINKFSIIDFLDSKKTILTDEFIYTQLAEEEQFQENGRFSKARFESFARSNGFIPSDYLKRVREDFLISIWRQSIINSSFITDLDVFESMALADQERDITFIKLSAERFKNSVIYQEEDLQNYYQENKSAYMSPDRAKVSYVSLDSKELQSTVKVSEEDIKLEYEDYLRDFDSSERKSVSHIMLNITETRDSSAASAELYLIKDRINQGEAFEELVLEVSEDGGTKDIEGSLGITDGTLLPPEFEQALLSMEEGEIFGPIELLSSVHLIRLDEVIKPEPKTFEDLSTKFREDLLTNKAEEIYVDLIEEVSDLAFSSDSIKDIAEILDKDLIETDYFSKSEIPEILSAKTISDFIFEDFSEGNFPELIETSQLSAVLIQISDYVEQAQLEYTDVRSQIEETYVLRESLKASEAFVVKSIEDLRDDKTLEIFSSENNVEVETYKGLKRDSSLLPVRAVNEIFSLPRSQAGDVFGSAVLQNGDSIIFRLDAVNESTADLTEENIAGIKNFLNQQKIISELSELQEFIKQGLSISG